MKIGLVSDLHLSHKNADRWSQDLVQWKQAAPDALLIAGDIADSLYVETALLALESALSIPIFFVLGNHDYFGSSLGEVRDQIRRLSDNSFNLTWLQEAGIQSLTRDAAVIGHECWGDGHGDCNGVDRHFSDFEDIEDFRSLSNAHRWKLKAELANESAEHLLRTARKAAKQHQKVLILTHAPPFPEACFRREGYPSEVVWPFFCSIAAGTALKSVAKEYSNTQFLVISGHTHYPFETRILPNLQIRVLAAHQESSELEILTL